ncbi:MAG: DUF4838 domain-containing protein [Ruminococcaceae bacterium]|nr:DUF4838 domain-containing protein [Oscillospiraceae bacterium]
MKRTVSLFLAVIMLAMSFSSCQTKENIETEQTIVQSETEQAETESQAAEEVALVTENGEARAHIVLSANADQNERYAAEELCYHIEKVSGAAVPVTDTVSEGSLPIVIGTPDTVPELETLFPEDLTWLREVGTVGGRERWGEDGFAIRTHEGKIYIFGAVSRGALNGVYDFIEENLGVLWIRAEEDIGLFYDEMPTITVEKTDYREKSPFAVRGLSQYCSVPTVSKYSETMRLHSRNKYNFAATQGLIFPDIIAGEAALGLQSIVAGHNIKYWLTTSPAYDPNEREYWATDANGNHGTYESSWQVNIWSKKTIDTIAASVLHSLDTTMETNPIHHVGICPEDHFFSRDRYYPEDSTPFEYAPGQFVNPWEEDFISTVYFVFLNDIARQVREKYPDVYIVTYGYGDAIVPPRCEIEDNVLVIFCSIQEDLSTHDMTIVTSEFAENNYKHFVAWSEKTPNLLCYAYYGCYLTAGYYERPIWHRMQNDLQTYASLGISGMTPAIYLDDDSLCDLGQQNWGFNSLQIWEMNILTHWMYAKLAWDPYADVDALIDEFCDRVYGDASDAMQEYYYYVKLGWEEGTRLMAEEWNVFQKWNTNPVSYFDYYLDIEVDGVYILDAIRAALDKAWEAADDRAKGYIRRPREAFANFEAYVDADRTLN